LRSLFDVDGSPAFGRAAITGNLLDVFRKVIVDGELFAFSNVAFCHVKNVAFGDQGTDVGVAAVIDVFGTAAAYRAIQGPIIIQCEQVNHRTLFIATPPRFLSIDAFAGVFNYLAISGNAFAGKEAVAVNAAALDIQLVLSEIRVNLGALRAERFDRGG